MVRGVERAHRAYQKSGGDAHRVADRAHARYQNRPEQAKQASQKEGARPQHVADRAHARYQNRPEQTSAERSYSSKDGDRAQFSQKAMHAADNRMGSVGQPTFTGKSPDTGATPQFSERTGVSFGGKG